MVSLADRLFSDEGFLLRLQKFVFLRRQKKPAGKTQPASVVESRESSILCGITRAVLLSVASTHMLAGCMDFL